MHQLKDFGFSTQSWRGQRGEYWVLAQVVLSIGFFFVPIYPTVDPGGISSVWQYVAWALAALTGLIAMGLLLGGVMALGDNLTPLPHPKDESELVTNGIYGVVRHPIYSGVIFGAIAYSCWNWSLSHGIGAILLLLFFDVKARKEEAWLEQKFTDYDAYRSRVKKLIPWLY